MGSNDVGKELRTLSYVCSTEYNWKMPACVVCLFKSVARALSFMLEICDIPKKYLQRSTVGKKLPAYFDWSTMKPDTLTNNALNTEWIVIRRPRKLHTNIQPSFDNNKLRDVSLKENCLSKGFPHFHMTGR